MKVKHKYVDVETSKVEIKEEEWEPPEIEPEPEGVDLSDLAKLVKHAKSKKWI